MLHHYPKQQVTGKQRNQNQTQALKISRSVSKKY